MINPITKLYQEQSRQSFWAFRQYINPKLKKSWWPKEVANELQQFWNDYQAGLRPKLVIMAPPQHGKQLADETPVLTTRGWKKHGDIVVGDFVYGINGKPIKVLWVSDKTDSTMRVELTNGEIFYCHKKHEWTVFNRDKKKTETIETEKMCFLGERTKRISPFYCGTEGKRGCHYIYQLPLVEPLINRKKRLPSSKQRRVAIKNIEKGDYGKQGNCIQVDSDDGIYLIGKTLQPTHNSSAVIDWISWIAGQSPNEKVIYASFSDRLGVRANLQLQRTISSDKYKQIFPETTLGQRCTQEFFEYDGQDGYFRNTTIRGSVTGESLDCGIIDDPIKGRLEANSETVRNAAWDWFTDDFSTRFSDKGALLIILTRWHIDDPVGRLLNIDSDVRILKYQAIAEHDEDNRKKGEPLFKEHKSLEFLHSIERRMFSSSWESLYQQSPIVKDGDIFKPDTIAVIEKIPYLCRQFVRAWDLGATSKGDWTVGVKMTRLDDIWIIVDIVRMRGAPHEVRESILKTAKRDGARCKVRIPQDPGQAGKAQVASFAAMLSGFSVKADPVTGDKETRASPLAGQLNIGNVQMVRGSWNDAFVDELRSFPNGKYDDQVDAVSDAFNDLTDLIEIDYMSEGETENFGVGAW